MHEAIHRALRAAHSFAWQQRHEYVTVEHLLMMVCRDIGENSNWQYAGQVEDDLNAYIAANNPTLCGEAIKLLGCTATVGLKRVVSRMKELLRQEEVIGSEAFMLMLLAFCVEKNSFAAYALHKHGASQALQNYFRSRRGRERHAKVN